MAHDHRSHEGADKLYDLIDDIRICMMTTVEEDGRLASRPMYGLEADQAGDLWFSTLADGVTRYDGTTFTVYRQLGGLDRTHVQGILQDKDGTMWFGCSGGLFRLDGTSFVNVTKNGPWR